MNARLRSSLLALVALSLSACTTVAGSDELVGPARWFDYPEADALAYAVELELDPARPGVVGRVEYRFRALADLDEVRLDLLEGPDYEVRFQDASGAPLEVRRAGDRVHVQLGRTVPAGETFTFQATLRGVPPDGLYFARTRHGAPCVLTDHYAVRARGWLPCEDHPRDRARFSTRLVVPEGYEAVFTGDVRSVPIAANAVPGGHRAWVGASTTDLPTYLYALAVARYARVDEGGDARLVPHYVYPEDRASALAALAGHGAWMRLMEATFGPYPYAKYCVAQAPTRWGGIENAGNTFVAEGLFDRPRGGAGTLAHELVHQWFGDGVGYADWYEVWLSEGFASYFGPWLDAQTGGPALDESLRRMRERWSRSDVAFTKPIRWRGYPDPADALNANTYPKGAWVLHMLRGELGDEAFFAGLRAYYAGHTGGAATTEDLRTALEAASGQDLAWFFTQWLDRPGCPELVFRWTSRGVVVRQLQAEPYSFRLRLAWTGQDGVDRERVFRIGAPETTLSLEGAPATGPIRVDPRVELLYVER